MAALCVLHFAELTVQTYQKTRSAKEPVPFFKTVSMKALDYPFINKAALPRKKGQTMNLSITTFKLKDIEVMETYHRTTLEEYFRQQYFENLVLIISSIKDYFNQTPFMTFLKMDQLLLHHSDKNYEDNLAYVFNVYKDDIDPMQVRTEAFSMSTMFQGSNCANFSVILERLESLHSTKHALIPNLLTIVHLILINPATICTTEKSFSVARRIKTWLRSTMKNKRFNNLSILSIHKELTESIDLVDIANDFASKYDEHRMNLGKFVLSDLL